MALKNLTLVTFILILTITLQIHYLDARNLKQNNISQLNAIEALQTKPISTNTTVESQPPPPPPPPRSAQDFRPTTPGHSPGAGHSIHN